MYDLAIHFTQIETRFHQTKAGAWKTLLCKTGSPRIARTFDLVGNQWYGELRAGSEELQPYRSPGPCERQFALLFSMAQLSQNFLASAKA